MIPKPNVGTDAGEVRLPINAFFKAFHTRDTIKATESEFFM